MSGAVSILNLEKFKNCVLFAISLKKWGNRARVKNMTALADYIAELEAPDVTEGEQQNGNGNRAESRLLIASDRVSTSKILIKSAAYKELCTEMNEIKAWCLRRAMPSYFRPGMFVVREAQVESIEQGLKEALAKLTAPEGKLEAFLASYPADIEKSRSNPVKKGGLGPIFTETDYPLVDELRKLFAIDWYWLAMSVPENIPDALKQEQNEKFKRRMADAAEDIENALREEFRDLLASAEEKLTTKPGEKPKVFRDSLIGNIKAFIETFDNRNMFADQQLAELVAKAKTALLDENGNERVTPKKLREYASVRDVARVAFSDIRVAMDAMIETKRTRKFELEET